MKIHFIAIGGSAMHNLAIALHQKGFQISGSDDVIFEPSKTRLQNKGILPENFGWFPEKITETLDAVILGMHAKADNPELLKAEQLGIKIYSYPEFIFQQSKNKTRVVIAGSHGKTTITAMVLHVLNFHHFSTDFMVGAQLKGFDCMVKLTHENDFIVLEGDEYWSSPIDAQPKFLHYQPNVCLISGIAWDHINVFKTFDEYLQSFKNLISKITPGGVLVYNEEDPEVVKLVENAENYFRKIPYKTPDYERSDDRIQLVTDFGKIPLEIFGKHNLLNLEGARHICAQLGILEEEFYEAIMNFEGAAKRLQKVERNDGVVMYQDFAHAPSKVKATVSAFKENFPKEETYGFLELHTYSSLNPEFLPQYKNTLEPLEQAIVFYDENALAIKKLAPISVDDIKNCFDKNNLLVFTNTADLHEYWKNLDKNNKVFLMMSSGNFGSLDIKN